MSTRYLISWLRDIIQQIKKEGKLFKKKQEKVKQLM
jgi:hypothetical protein